MKTILGVRKGLTEMDASERVAVLSIAINLVIFGIKYLSAVASGSIALKAEAFHSFADFIAAVTVFAGVKLAKRKTKSFPYGLYKIENLMSVVISLIVLYSGYEIILEVINNNQEGLKDSWLAIASLLVSIALTFWFSSYEMKIGQEINSPILLADATHIRIDVLSNVVVLFAIASSMIGYHLDKMAAVIIVGFIIKTGFQIFKDGVRVLLDASLDYETLSKVEKIIIDIPQVVSVKALTGRNSGKFKFIETSIVIKTRDLNKAHFVADKIEGRIKEQVKNIDRILIHYEPIQKEQIVYALPLTEDQSSISSHFGEAMFFMFVTFDIGNKTAKKIDVVENPFCRTEKGKGILSAEFMAKKMVDFVLVKNGFHSKGPSYVFSDANIEVIVTDKATLKSAFEERGLMVYSTLEVGYNG